MVVKRIGCFGPTSILQAIVATAELIRLGRVYAGQADALPVNFERVAVDDGGSAYDCFGECRRRNERDKRCDQETVKFQGHFV
jgi:hypothetical protein